MEQRLKIILLESGLELVPRELLNEPEIIKTAKRYGIRPEEVILDKSLHFHAMYKLSRKWKRGRPDIVHTTLLVIEGSLAGRRGLIETFIHTIDGRVFAVRPETRIPKNYERFKGLVAQLLKENRVPPNSPKPLIYKVANTLGEFVREYGKIILLWEKGNDANEFEIVARALTTNMPIGIGMFPRGDFEKSTLRKAAERYRLFHGESLPAWTIAARIIYAYETILFS
jgi:rRNA small subunit pseudouridine methyltransferase Nep1